MIKNKIYLILPILFSSCVQEPANIVLKEGVDFKQKNGLNTLQPSYMTGTYVVGKDNKVVRDIRADNTKTIDEQAEEEKKNEENKERKIDREYSIITVKQGDNLINLSKMYNMQFSDMVELNNLNRPYNIYVGQKLKVFKNVDNEKYSKIVVEQGDSLLKIALEYNMSLRELASINNIRPPYNVYVGQKLKVPNSKTRKPDFYVVEKGDNLYGISRKTNISVSQLIKNNNLGSPNNIYPGQKLYLAEHKSDNGYVKKENTNNKEEAGKKEEEVKENANKNIAKEETEQKDTEKDLEKTKEIVAKNDVVFAWPVKGEVIKKFGKQSDGKFYDAINIKADLETPILASMDGEIAYAGNELKGFGNIIIIKHNSGWLSIYGYCDKINVKVKDKVSKGQVIATVGKTGNVNEPQLYFSIRKGRVTMDPLKYLENNN